METAIRNSFHKTDTAFWDSYDRETKDTDENMSGYGKSSIYNILIY